MPVELNVPPVVGKTPAQVVQELRVTIRDEIWRRIVKNKGLLNPGALPGQTNKNHVAFKANNQELSDIFDKVWSITLELDEVAALRKPSDVKKRTSEIRAQIGRMHQKRRRLFEYGAWAFSYIKTPPAQIDDDLIRAVDRAYALVQAIPSYEGTSKGQEQNLIRTITVMLKVYYGLDVEASVEQLPNVMPDLMALLAEGGKRAQS